MYIEKESIDDIMYELFEKLLKIENKIRSTKGTIYEILGVYIRLSNPLARLSITQTKGKIISPLGELFWYLSASNDLESIKYYLQCYSDFSDDGVTLNGAYGPRMFAMYGSINQFDYIIELLKIKPNTKKAVIQIFDATDLVNSDSNDTPCTCTLQFFIRENKLHMFTYMRSNDAYLGLYHDIFCFTMIQEIITRTLGVELGSYNHFVSSLHLYDDKIKKAKKYLSEGYQSHNYLMPAMPQNDIKANIDKVKELEKRIREEGIELDFESIDLPDYWKDILIFFKIYSLRKANKYRNIVKLKSMISNKVLFNLINEKYKQ